VSAVIGMTARSAARADVRLQHLGAWTLAGRASRNLVPTKARRADIIQVLVLMRDEDVVHATQKFIPRLVGVTAAGPCRRVAVGSRDGFVVERAQRMIPRWHLESQPADEPR
jgi:hypothetical protein